MGLLEVSGIKFLNFSYVYITFSSSIKRTNIYALVLGNSQSRYIQQFSTEVTIEVQKVSLKRTVLCSQSPENETILAYLIHQKEKLLTQCGENWRQYSPTTDICPGYVRVFYCKQKVAMLFIISVSNGGIDITDICSKTGQRNLPISRKVTNRF